MWGLPAGKTPVAPAVDNSMYERYSGFNPGEGKWGVNRAQALALQYGVMIPARVPSEGYGRGGFDANERDLTGGAFPMFYDLPIFNTTMMESLGKGAPWALAKALTGKNSMCNVGEPRDFMNEYMLPYASTLVDIQYGNEGGFNRVESECFKNWFSWSKQNIPGAVVHANSWDDPSWYRGANLSYYVDNAKPDLLSWNKYYWGANGGPAPSRVVMDLLNTNTWKKQREYGLKGLTGDGSSPILYGQYLDYNWDANVSASEKSIVPSLGLVTGQKWFGLFRMEYNGYDSSSIIDHDGAPTRSFYEFSNIFGNVTYIGNYTKAMNSTFVAYKPGQYAARGEAPSLSGYKYGDFASGDEAKAANEAVGLVDMSVANVGSVNNGLPGDVVVGYFEQLKGLDTAKSAEIFGDSTTAPKGFMVVNALTGQTRYPSYLLDPRTDNGSLAETAQDITLTVKKPAPTPDPAPQPRTGQGKSGYFGCWYSYSDGTFAANETLVIDGQTYRFDANGYLKMGWVYDGGHWYYHGSSGAQQYGWIMDRGSWYYLSPPAPWPPAGSSSAAPGTTSRPRERGSANC